MMKKSHNKNRVFKNQPGYVQNHNGRWVKKDTTPSSNTDISVISDVGGDFDTYDALQQEINAYNIALEDISHKVEKNLRSMLY